MPVRLTDAAEADLESIGDYIATNNPVRAATFVSELVDRCNGLADQGHRYGVFAVREDRELRRCRHGNYLIFFSLLVGEVEVTRIIHQSRDYVRLLFPDD